MMPSDDRIYTPIHYPLSLQTLWNLPFFDKSLIKRNSFAALFFIIKCLDKEIKLILSQARTMYQS